VKRALSNFTLRPLSRKSSFSINSGRPIPACFFAILKLSQLATFISLNHEFFLFEKGFYLPSRDDCRYHMLNMQHDLWDISEMYQAGRVIFRRTFYLLNKKVIRNNCVKFATFCNLAKRMYRHRPDIVMYGPICASEYFRYANVSILPCLVASRANETQLTVGFNPKRAHRDR